MGTLSHILGPLVGFIVPLILWAVRSPNLKEEDPLLNSHLSESLNASITFLIAAIIHSVLSVVLIGCLTFAVHLSLIHI